MENMNYTMTQCPVWRNYAIWMICIIYLAALAGWLLIT